MILLIDNYDSFSYNLYQLIGTLDPDIRVVRNDALAVEDIAALNPGAIVLSPGPGRPDQAGICIECVKKLGSKYPMLGVCLGHQSICEAFGAKVSYAKELMHGKQCRTFLDRDCALFKDMSETVLVARYHSLAAEEETIPECLKVTARAEDGEIMAVKHRDFEIYGVQFHPESIMTPEGQKMMQNFLDSVK